MDSYLSTKLGKILFSAVLVMGVVALASMSQLNTEKAKYAADVPATISVTGEGEVLAVPDIGQFSFSVNASGEDAATAQEESGTKINAILAYLKEAGVEDKDVKTQNYNMYPKWRYEERICVSNSYCPPGERVEDGFEVSQSVSVKVRDTENAGAIIAGVGDKGATNISSLNFTIDDTDALKAEAREIAIKDAQDKAAVLAAQLGVKVNRIVSYYEDEGYGYNKVYAETRAFGLDDSDEGGFGGASLPVGEDSTTARVTITYEVL